MDTILKHLLYSVCSGMLISEFLLELLIVGDRIIGSVAGVVIYVDIITWDGRVTPLVNVIAALVDGVTVFQSCEALYSVEPTVLEDG